MIKSKAIGMFGMFLLCATGCSSSGDVLQATQESQTSDGRDRDGGGGGGGSCEGGCNPDKNGTRLKVMYERWYGEDGASIYVAKNRLYDSKLDVDCQFEVAEDAVRRCLPLISDLDGQALPFVPYNSTSGYFQDASCTQPVLSHPSCAPIKYAYGTATPAAWCRPVRSVYKLTKITPTVLYSKNFGSPCSMVSATELANILAGGTLYSTDHVAPSEFVKGDMQRAIKP